MLVIKINNLRIPIYRSHSNAKLSNKIVMQLKVSYTCELYKRDGSENAMMMGGV